MKLNEFLKQFVNDGEWIVVIKDGGIYFDGVYDDLEDDFEDERELIVLKVKSDIYECGENNPIPCLEIKVG